LNSSGKSFGTSYGGRRGHHNAPVACEEKMQKQIVKERKRKKFFHGNQKNISTHTRHFTNYTDGAILTLGDALNGVNACYAPSGCCLSTVGEKSVVFLILGTPNLQH